MENLVTYSGELQNLGNQSNLIYVGKNPLDILIGKNLRRLREGKGLSQEELGALTNTVKQKISALENAKHGMGKELITRFSHALNVEPYEFYLPLGAKPTVSVPVLARVPAGFPKDTPDEDIIEHLSLPDVPKGAFSVVVTGDSMMPEIRDGDYALFLPTKDIKNGDIVIVANEYGEAMVKRFRVKDGGASLLTSDNPEYPSFKPNKHFRIIGKVIQTVRVRKV